MKRRAGPGKSDRWVRWIAPERMIHEGLSRSASLLGSPRRRTRSACPRRPRFGLLVPSRGHPPRCLALPSVHPQLPRRRGVPGGTGHRGHASLGQLADLWFGRAWWKEAGLHGLCSVPPLTNCLHRFHAPCGQLTILHALELQPVGVEEEHGIIILIVLASRVDDLSAELL